MSTMSVPPTPRPRPKCTEEQTSGFIDHLNAASGGCVTATTYKWDGYADPTNAERANLCKCTVSAFEVPKCWWLKLGMYMVPPSQHVPFAFNCTSKAAPVVTEVDAIEPKAPVRPKCTEEQTSRFIDHLSAASGGCVTATTYKWDGYADPTNAERANLCKCTVSAFEVPKCWWLKLGMYMVPPSQHVPFAFNCTSKAAPVVTEVDAMVTTESPLTTSVPPTSTAPAIDDCTLQQISTFTSQLNSASSGCIGGTSYNWGGTSNPTETQYSEICKCTSVTSFTIPICAIMKGPDRVTLSAHNDWVRSTQCASRDPLDSSNNVGMIAGIGGGIVAAVMLIIGFVLLKRHRKRQQEDQYQPHTDTPAIAMISPVDLRSTTTNTDKNRDSRPSGHSTARTTSTAKGNSYSNSNSNSNNTAHMWRSTEPAGTWDDPVITAVRIPRDSIFFGALLSRGGYGEVYQGMYQGERVAIKQLLPARRKDLAQIDDFLCEVKLMSSLDHERIVQFIGVAWSSLSDACLVVEYMENGDLRSVLGRWNTAGPEKRRNGFDADKIKIALHIAHALVYLHSLQPVVVHRDLKSRNILLDANFDAKLTDFGVSRERADMTMTAGVGSALWMAPEVMMGSRYDEKADIFSFGVVLSELDTHQLPYAHAKVSEPSEKIPEASILQQVMLGRLTVSFTERAHPELVQLARECVSLDPTARPTTAQVLHRVHLVMRQ